MLWRFASGLSRFLRFPLSPEDCLLVVRQSLRDRQKNFLLLLKKAVFGYPKSPYSALLRWAGVEYGDVDRMVGQDGVETTLERLFEAGVHVGLDEFKGRRPILRNGFSLEVTSEDFDNPLLAREFEVQTSGSTGPRRRLAIDFDLLTIDASYRYLCFRAHGMEARPLAVYRAVPPGSSGIKNALFAAKFGNPLERWYSPTALSLKPSMLKSALFSSLAVCGGQLLGRRIPIPRHVPLDNAAPVSRWLATKVRMGTPALLSGPVSSLVRVVAAAKREGLDITDTMFLAGGEPITDAKVDLLSELGVRICPNWAMSEAGPLGGGCADRQAIDEIHLYRGKIAVLQHPRRLSDQSTVSALYLTTLRTETPKIMLNLESGDYGVLKKRRCGCMLGDLGLNDHLQAIRNYEKLTTGGMHFVGSEIVALVEQVLPDAFGGHPTDYQIVEEEEGAVTHVSLVISPRVGVMEEHVVVNRVLEYLARGSRGNRMMAEHWKQAGALRVVRHEPFSTPEGKIPPLRVRWR
jgi:hypothetical protein